MAFDEQGQADTFARKTEICRGLPHPRGRGGFPPEDIIFDPNIFAIATGIEEHDNYAVVFINATRWISSEPAWRQGLGRREQRLFSFRGNEPAREAIHTVFLYHAIQAGMDMGIVNRMLGVYDEIEPAENASKTCWNRSQDAGIALVDDCPTVRKAPASSDSGPDLPGAPATLDRSASATLFGEGALPILSSTTRTSKKPGKPGKAVRPAASDRRPADGRHERSSATSFWRRARCSAPGREERPRHEEAVAHLVPYIRGAESAASGGATPAPRGKHPDRHGPGRRTTSARTSSPSSSAATATRSIDLGVMVQTGISWTGARKWAPDIIGLSASSRLAGRNGSTSPLRWQATRIQPNAAS